MSDTFSGYEIVQLGIEIEKNGRDFYKEAAAKSRNKTSKEIFEYLADEEEKHIITFQGILDSVYKYEPTQAYPEEYFAYMKALASDYVFTKENKGKEMARRAKSDIEVVDIGINTEKNSILFYESMRKIVPPHDYDVLNELISQEQGHLKRLIELKAEI